MLVTTTERIPGQEYEVLGECFGGNHPEPGHH